MALPQPQPARFETREAIGQGTRDRQAARTRRFLPFAAFVQRAAASAAPAGARVETAEAKARAFHAGSGKLETDLMRTHVTL
jgi:hypothetical protein